MCFFMCFVASRAPKPSPSAPPSAISATPATQNDGRCEVVPRLPRVCVCVVCVCCCVLLCVVVVVCGCACVCVYHLNRCKTSHWFFTNLQGVVAGSRVYHQRRRSGFPGDTWPDQPCVPANFTEMGRGSTQEPPRRPFETSIYCTVVAIWNQFWSFTISSAASEPSSVFSPKPCRRQYF